MPTIEAQPAVSTRIYRPTGCSLPTCARFPMRTTTPPSAPQRLARSSDAAALNGPAEGIRLRAHQNAGMDDKCPRTKANPRRRRGSTNGPRRTGGERWEKRKEKERTPGNVNCTVRYMFEKYRGHECRRAGFIFALAFIHTDKRSSSK